jgi:hypothetical protein
MELKKLRPLDEDLLRYSDFLKGRETGITRLEPYRGCGDLTKVVSASEDCIEFSMPGHGSDYSFRKRAYRLGRLADIRLDADAFSSPGVLQQAVFVGLGDVPIEKVGTNTPGMALITELRPAENIAAAFAISERFKHGSEKDGFYYATALRAVENMTYVLRSVAYRGRVLRSVAGAVYNELDLDERADVTVAFRIVRKHDSGGVTLVWRELSRRKAPELSSKGTVPSVQKAAPLSQGK